MSIIENGDGTLTAEAIMARLTEKFSDEELTIADLLVGLAEQADFIDTAASQVGLQHIIDAPPFGDNEQRDQVASRLRFIASVTLIVADRVQATVLPEPKPAAPDAPIV